MCVRVCVCCAAGVQRLHRAAQECARANYSEAVLALLASLNGCRRRYTMSWAGPCGCGVKPEVLRAAAAPWRNSCLLPVSHPPTPCARAAAAAAAFSSA